MAMQRLSFGPFVLDLVDERLWRDGQALRLGYKSQSLLRHLVINAGCLVRKEDLLAAVWPDTHVSPAVLKVCVSEIRQVLGEDPSAPRYIETVRPRGYRFIASVQEAPAARHPADLLEDLLTQSHIVLDAAGWALSMAPGALAARVPPSTRRTIERHLASLGEDGRRTLEAASAVGLEFDAEQVALALGEPLLTAEERCERLARPGLLLRAAEPTALPDGSLATCYAFPQELYCQVLREGTAAARAQRYALRLARHRAPADGQAGAASDCGDGVERARRAWDESLRLAREAEALHSTAEALRQRARGLRDQRAAERLRWDLARRTQRSGGGRAPAPAY